MAEEEQWEADLIRRADDAADEIIMEHKLASDTLRDVTTVPGVHAGQALTYNMLVGLMKKVEDEAYKAPLQYIAPGRRDEIPPDQYDPHNPFHYIQRYGMRPTPIMPRVPAHVLSDAEALEILTRARRGVDAILGRGNAEALPKSDAGDIVNSVISRDETGRFAAVSGDDQEIQHDPTPAVVSEPVREPASDAESEAGAVNRNPQ